MDSHITTLEKIVLLLSVIVKEYIIGTSVYLLALFILKMNNQVSIGNAVFWVIIVNFIFQRFVISEQKEHYLFKGKTIIITQIIRAIFIIINLIGFGINIFA